MLNEQIYNDTTGTLLLKLRRQGERDIDKIALAMHNLRKEQREAGIFSFDCFTDKGSHTHSNLALETDTKSHAAIIWSINHYLGLNRHPIVIEKAIQAVREYGTGCGTSAISGGMNTLHKQIEAKIGEWLNTDSVMLFPTGYSANMGLLAAIAQAEDHVLIDEESHASIRDGVRLSAAKKWITFEHNSIADLECKLIDAQTTCAGKIIVVVESAYSMSGDVCPLKALGCLKEKYKFLLMVDEAHSFGLYGEGGKGLCHQEGILQQVDFLTATFSKATASIGGFVATQSKYVSYLQWSANVFAFQACFSPADAGTILAAMEVIESEPSIIAKLHANTRYMREQLLAAGFDLRKSETPIIPVYIADIKKLLRVSFDLFKRGVFSVPIAYPMVKSDAGRIRFIVNANHTKAQIDKTVAILRECAEQYELLPERPLIVGEL